MADRLIYPESYIRHARKFIKRPPELIGQDQKTLELLEITPRHPSFRMRPLKR